MIQRISLALACLSALVLGTSCVPMGGGGSTVGGGSCGGSFGTTQAAAKITAFVGAASEFSASAAAAEQETLDACKRMGVALGMSAGELSGSGTDGMQNVCNAVHQRFASEMQQLRQANVQINIMARPPVCEVSVNAYAECAAHCEADIQPGQVEIQCEGGEIRGQCDAQCTGSCSVSVQGQCTGRCEGACNGQCSAQNADGSCAGQCNGSCNGSCVVQAQASCQGECRGGCSVQYREPYCTGNVTPPRVSAECDGYCDAHAEASAHCTPGEVEVGVSGVNTQADRIARIQAAARAGLGSIAGLRLRLQRLQQSAGTLARLAPGVPRAAIQVSAGAVACATEAAGATARAMASVNVSVQVNVQMSASISGSAG